MLSTVTRRHFVPVAGVAAAASLCAAPAPPRTAIHQEMDYKVDRERIYKALLDARQFSAVAQNDWQHLNKGWPIRYWEPLRRYLES